MSLGVEVSGADYASLGRVRERLRFRRDADRREFHPARVDAALGGKLPDLPDYVEQCLGVGDPERSVLPSVPAECLEYDRWTPM